MKNLIDGYHKLNSLQYIRALSAIAVVLYHVESDINKRWVSDDKIFLFSWGHLGVPMFFCLSGFVISYSGYLRPKKPLEFIYSRLARIYPAYLATTIVFIGCLIALPLGTFNSTPSVSIGQILKMLIFDFGRPEGGYIYTGWTLYYELIFYLCFSLLINKFSHIAKDKKFYYSISVGMAVCYLFGRERIADFLIGISIFLIVCQTLDEKATSAPYSVLYASLMISLISNPIGFFCGLIITVCIKLENTKPAIFRYQLILIMGDSSYSIYLIQVLTISASIKILALISSRTGGIGEEYFTIYTFGIVFAFFLTVLAGVIMRNYVEKPSYQCLMGRIGSKRLN
jgi:exopolysaccharide production protein ExoZ